MNGQNGPARSGLHVAIDGRVIDDHFPGIGRYVYQLVIALRELAEDLASGAARVEGGRTSSASLHEDRQAPLRISLLYTEGQRDSRFGLSELLDNPGPRLQPIWVRAPVFGLSGQWRMRSALRRSGADLFHATYWLGPYWPGKPSLLTVYDRIGAELPGAVPGARRLLLRLALRMALRSADGIVTISQAAREELIASGIAAERLGVTPLGVDPRFQPASRSELGALRERLELPERFLLYLGSNKPHKNLPLLLRAWAAFQDQHPELAGLPGGGPRLVIGGAWDERYPEARAIAASSSYADSVAFIGAVAEADLPLLYSAAEAFAFPSLREGFGLPPLEAMACGTPVLAADCSSLPEVVGDAGLLLAPDDVQAWAEAIANLLGNPDHATDLSARGLARAAGFSWARCAAESLEAYRAIIR